VFDLLFAFLLKVHNTGIMTGRWCNSKHWREMEKALGSKRFMYQCYSADQHYLCIHVRG